MSGGGPSFAGVSISALSAGGAPLPGPVIFCRYRYKFRVEIIVKICTFEFLLFTFLTTKGSMMLRKYLYSEGLKALNIIKNKILSKYKKDCIIEMCNEMCIVSSILHVNYNTKSP